jgi:F-type H+-transporting ATPase subunit delta
MQASDRILARRYALALFEAGIDHGQEERLHQDLVESTRLLRDKVAIFRHPLMGAVLQKALLRNLVGAKISERTFRFLEILIEKKRFSLLPLITTDYEAMLDAHRGIARAQVSSAGKMAEPEQAHLRRDLKNSFGKEIILDVKESPELLGGMVVRMGDWVLDGSLQGKLRRLAAQLAEES